MQPDSDFDSAKSMTTRSIIAPMGASALVALIFEVVSFCGLPTITWVLVAAPAFALVGAVAGPEQSVHNRWRIGLISAVLNLLVMVTVGYWAAAAMCSP